MDYCNYFFNLEDNERVPIVCNKACPYYTSAALVNMVLHEKFKSDLKQDIGYCSFFESRLEKIFNEMHYDQLARELCSEDENDSNN